MVPNNPPKMFRIFYPGKDFPAISISGNRCELDCAHCGGKYLNQMLAVNSPKRLIALCEALARRGAAGALISGGCDSEGHVMLDEYIDALAVVKQRTKLLLNVHTGLMTRDQVRKLVNTAVDIASVDIVGDSGTIQNVYGLAHSPTEYKTTLQTLEEEGMKSIVPHICIGLDYGRLKGEFNAIDMLSGIEPSAIVFIILIPTKGSKMANCAPPSIKDGLRVIRYARSKYQATPLYLGCMRPRSKAFREYTVEFELKAIDAGINGIVIPSKQTLQYLQEKSIPIKERKSCCAMG